MFDAEFNVVTIPKDMPFVIGRFLTKIQLVMSPNIKRSAQWVSTVLSLRSNLPRFDKEVDTRRVRMMTSWLIEKVVPIQLTVAGMYTDRLLQFDGSFAQARCISAQLQELSSNAIAKEESSVLLSLSSALQQVSDSILWCKLDEKVSDATGAAADAIGKAVVNTASAVMLIPAYGQATSILKTLNDAAGYCELFDKLRLDKLAA